MAIDNIRPTPTTRPVPVSEQDRRRRREQAAKVTRKKKPPKKGHIDEHA